MSKKKINIKEYIYVDNIEINSLLAQFEDGIPQVIQSIRQSQKANTEGNSKAKSNGVKGGLNAGGVATVDHGQTNTEQFSETIQEMNQEAITTVYNDYAIDILTKELDDAEVLKVTSKQRDGAFVQLTSTFEIMDADTMDRMWNSSDLIEMMSSSSDGSIEWDAGIKAFSQVSNILNNSLPETIFIKLPSAVILAENKNFRMSNAQLQSLQFTDRKITVLGKIESKASEEALDIAAFGEMIGSSEDLSQFGKVAPYVNIFLLNQFVGLKKDDRLIKPIAIYFE